MTAQEKINRLALAALRSAPPAASLPEPVTYMAPFEKPKTVAMVDVPKPAAAPVTATDPADKMASGVPAVASRDEPEPRAAIREPDARIGKRRSRKGLVVTLSVLGLLAAAGVGISRSPEARTGAMSLVPALKQGADDVKMPGSIATKDDGQLDKAATRGDRIGGAPAAEGKDVQDRSR